MTIIDCLTLILWLSMQVYPSTLDFVLRVLCSIDSLYYSTRAQANLVFLEMVVIVFPEGVSFLASFLRAFVWVIFPSDGGSLINFTSSESIYISILMCFVSSSLQKAVEKLKVAMHHQRPALQAKIVISW